MVFNSQNNPEMLIQGQVATVYGHFRLFWCPYSAFPPSNWSVKHVANNEITFWLDSDGNRRKLIFYHTYAQYGAPTIENRLIKAQ